MGRRTLLLFAFLLVAAALASCDGGDGGGGDAQTQDGDLAGQPEAVAVDAAPGPEDAAPIVPRPDLAAPAADRIAAVVEAAEEADRTSQCSRGIEFLRVQLDGFDGPATDRDLVRTGLETAVAALETGDLVTCMDAFSDPLSVLGYVITPGTPEPVPCVRGIEGAIPMIAGLDGEGAAAQLFLEAAVAALEAGDFDGCFIALGEALEIVRKALEAGG